MRVAGALFPGWAVKHHGIIRLRLFVLDGRDCTAVDRAVRRLAQDDLRHRPCAGNHQMPSSPQPPTRSACAKADCLRNHSCRRKHACADAVVRFGPHVNDHAPKREHSFVAVGGFDGGVRPTPRTVERQFEKSGSRVVRDGAGVDAFAAGSLTVRRCFLMSHCLVCASGLWLLCPMAGEHVGRYSNNDALILSFQPRR